MRACLHELQMELAPLQARSCDQVQSFPSTTVAQGMAVSATMAVFRIALSRIGDAKKTHKGLVLGCVYIDPGLKPVLGKKCSCRIVLRTFGWWTLCGHGRSCGLGPSLLMELGSKYKYDILGGWQTPTLIVP